MSSSATGSKRERELVNEARDAGWPAARIGASGAGTDHDLPDCIILTDVCTLVVEAKYRTDPYVSLTEAEIDALCRFGEPRGVIPVVALRTDGRTYSSAWKVWGPKALNRTEGGNYSITRSMWDANDWTLADLLDQGQGFRTALQYGVTDDD